MVNDKREMNKERIDMKFNVESDNKWWIAVLCFEEGMLVLSSRELRFLFIYFSET